ncbi:MAG: hypothetical protein AB1758_34955, partial [Candidatus Eremiobacterota bacterium]
MQFQLVFPPQWTPLNPHFSLAALNGHLRRRGVDVRLADLNLRFYRRVLTREYLEYTRTRALHTYHSLIPQVALELRRRSGRLGLLAARFERLERFLVGEDSHLFQAVADRLEDAVAVFRDRERFYDPAELVQAYLTVDRALELVSLPYYPHRIRFNDFAACQVPLTSESALRYSRDAAENPFLPFLSQQAREIARSGADVVGISINAHAQLLPGLTLARLLKEVPDRRFHLTLGGNHFVRIREGLMRGPDFLRHFADSVILGEGEVPVDGLLDCLESGRELGDVPGLVHLSAGGRPVATRRP